MLYLRPERFPLAWVGLCLLLALGCGRSHGDGAGFPVAGTVTLDGDQLTGGVVLFFPDPGKGNKSTSRPAGAIDAHGSYTLLVQWDESIPPGWYKVAVQAFESAGGGNHPRSLRQRPPLLIPSVYTRPETSNLEVEVVENPATGAYDLHLAR
jgi:hypothetical protein